MTFDHYGTEEVLQLRDVDVPDVGEDGILVRVRAASLNPADWHMTNGVPRLARLQMGLRPPRGGGVGIDLAGRVEAVGAAVTRFRPGDDVFGITGMRPGSTVYTPGSIAEYVRVTQDVVRPVPLGLDAVEAAAVPLAATTALRGLRDVAGLAPGQHVLVNGASGGVGTFAVQLAVALGARVTAVCSTRNVDLVASLGASSVIDYTREDPTTTVRAADVVLDNVGNHPVRAWRRVLTSDGVYVASFGRKEHRVVGPLPRLVGMVLLRPFASQRLAFLPTRWDVEELEAVSSLISSGQVRPVVGRTHDMADTAAALHHLGQGHARGKVVVTIQEG